MSWLETVRDYAEGAAGEFGPAMARILLPQLLIFGIDSGQSGRSMLADIRAAGIQIANDTYWKVLGETRAAAAMAAEWPRLDPSLVPSASEFVDYSVPRPYGVQYNFEVLVSDRAGEMSWVPRMLRYATPVTPGEAMSDMYDAFMEQAMVPGTESELFTVQGMRLSGLYNLVEM